MSSVSVNQNGDAVIIAISGRFDFNLLQDFRDSYTNLGDANLKYTVDLSGTDYIDSSALGMLLNMKNNVKAEDGAITISNCQPNLMKIFSIAHFDKKFQFV